VDGCKKNRRNWPVVNERLDIMERQKCAKLRFAIDPGRDRQDETAAWAAAMKESAHAAISYIPLLL